MKTVAHTVVCFIKLWLEPTYADCLPISLFLSFNVLFLFIYKIKSVLLLAALVFTVCFLNNHGLGAPCIQRYKGVKYDDSFLCLYGLWLLDLTPFYFSQLEIASICIIISFWNIFCPSEKFSMMWAVYHISHAIYFNIVSIYLFQWNPSNTTICSTPPHGQVNNINDISN